MEPPGQEFETVLAAAGAGGEWAFSLLYRRYNPLLLRYFAARVAGEAEDLAAETWVAVARQIPSFRGDETGFRAWLFTIAHHRLVQHWRQRRDPPADTGPYEALSGPDDPEGQVLGNLSAVEAARRIAAALSPDQAEIVLLRVLGGLDVEQVARIVGKRPGAVRVLQHRALKKLATEKFSLEV